MTEQEAHVVIELVKDLADMRAMQDVHVGLLRGIQEKLAKMIDKNDAMIQDMTGQVFERNDA